MSLPRLIVNADDLGMSRGINDAILAVHTGGILTSASLMANQPASDHAIDLLHQMPNLGVGIHLNLTSGSPVLSPREIPSLVGPGGNFHPRDLLFQKLWRFQVSATQIKAEFRAQIRWLKERGVQPVHADSHLHVHIYPAALQPFIRALRSEGIQRIRAPRCTVWPAQGPAGGPHEGAIARRLLVEGYRTALQKIALRSFQMPHSRVSFCADDRRDYASIGRSWITALDHLPAETFELACHPGFFERGFSESDRIAAQRQEEAKWLVSDELRAAVARNCVQLIRYADVSRNTAPQIETAELSARET